MVGFLALSNDNNLLWGFFFGTEPSEGGFMLVTAQYYVSKTLKILNRCLGIQPGFCELCVYFFTKQANI